MGLRLCTRIHPRVIRPREGRVGDDGACVRRTLCLTCHRVGVFDPVARVRLNRKLVELADGKLGYEEFPHATRAKRAHGMRFAVPRVEVAHNANVPRVRRPHSERNPARGAGHARVVEVPRAEYLPQAFVTTFANEVKIELTECGRKSVGIIGDPHLTVVVGRFDCVILQAQRVSAFPDSTDNVCEFDSSSG